MITRLAAMVIPKIFLTALVAIFWTSGFQNVRAASGAVSQASLVAEQKAIAAGGRFSIALRLVHPAGWHSYYKNSGGVELPPAIEWTLPAGVTAGPIQWPVPEVKDGYLGKSFVYSGSPFFIVELTAPTTLKLGDYITITAAAKWQICKASCINEEQAFTLSLPVATTAESDPATAGLFTEGRASQAGAHSGPLPSAVMDGESILLRVVAASAPTEFIPDQPFLLPASAGGGITREGDAFLVKLKRATVDAFGNPIPQGKSFSGILVGQTSIALPEITIASPAAESLPLLKFLPVLGGMLLGGLILNLMPCVFPVIGLKIMGFVQQAGADRRKIALHGMTFTVGVLASFGVLSGILFAARSAGGEAIGWGYQLQNPWVVLVLLLLMFVLIAVCQAV